MLQHILQRIDVSVLEGFEGFGEPASDIGLEMADLRPVRSLGDKERVFVWIGELSGDLGFGHPLCF